MKKHFLLPTIITLLFCTHLFAEQLVQERKVTNHVQHYNDKIWLKNGGKNNDPAFRTVRIRLIKDAKSTYSKVAKKQVL